MSQLVIKLGQISKSITIPKMNSSQDLSRMIESIFKIKQKVVGATDECGKFFDLQFINDNIKIMQGHALQLVTAKDANQDNMSFASDNVEGFNGYPKKQQVTLQSELLQKAATGFLGFISDLELFEQLLLEQKKLAIVICCSNKSKSDIKISYNYYVAEHKVQSAIIYYDRRKLAQLYIEDWRTLQTKIDSIAKNLYNYQRSSKNQQQSEQNNPSKRKSGQKQSQPQVQQQKQQDQFSDISNKSIADNEMAVEEIKNTFLQNLTKLRDQQTISELQFYKLKAKLLENPEDFMRKYQMGTRQGFRKRKSIDELRDQIVRSKQQKLRYQTIINEFKGNMRPPSRGENSFARNIKNQIPIIVRKYNNVIQKISTSYPLNVEQEQAINLIMELELKGLITENDARNYKSHILQEDPEIFHLFSQYFQEFIDQIELAHRLKNKKKHDKRNEQQRNRSEDIVRMIIKYAKRNSFELLRNLAVQGNSYIMQYYEQYLRDRNAANFGQSLEKVAAYYMTKSKLEEDFKGN